MRVTTLGELLPGAARAFGERTALICGDEQMSFAALDRQSRRLAAYLVGLGLRPGDRVSLWMENSVQWVVCYYAVYAAGAVVNPLNALLTLDEVAFATRDCDAKAIITTAERARALDARPGLQDPPLIVTVDGDGPAALSTILAGPDPDPDLPAPSIDPRDLAAIAYTSGTTGRPKGARLSHRGLVLNAALTAQMHGRTDRDTVVTALPLPHVYGNVILNSAVLTGMTVILQRKFAEAVVLADIERHRATLFEGVPTMYHYLLAYPELDRFDLSSLTRCTVGGQTMPVAKMEEVERRFGCPLLELWGMTELGGLGTTHASRARGALGSIGVALPSMEVRIAGVEPGRPDPPRGEVGELCVRGPLVMQGYHGNEAATREAIDPEGWLHTGDLARQDADGYVHVVDRKKDLILTAGYNIYPAELERVVAMHPAVALVAVGSVPDEAKGEVPKAYVVLRPGMTVTEAELLTHCRAHLAAYKVPRAVTFVDDLPKTSTGKVLRRNLRTLETDATA
ncbi:AMP-binding protein [Silanimonas sp.]|jgi:long-chain acyl-CoA synthetase|uniref:class I adenylate-forming enzyme family protein n=1 Tax=Silanimonas sp. TaxID=1929290 RepID=UPI0022C0B00A|nr:AMP-binding protein [Silanimonas sp.]MCZ8116322.1 AMP-binding protein [Silanimonas sp.]